MLQLRVYGDSTVLVGVAGQLNALPGARHVSLVEPEVEGPALVTADVRSDAADPALAMLEMLGVPAGDVALVRLDTITPGARRRRGLGPHLGGRSRQARTQARAPARYFALMASAGVIAAFAVVNDSATLIVGGMAINPDLLPVTAACTGLVFRRRRLVQRGIGTLIVGLGTAGLLAT